MTHLAGLAFRNVQRHRFRTAITVAAIATGVAALILVGGFVRDIFVQLAEAIIHSQTGHLQVMRPGLLGAGSRSPEQHMLNDLDRIRRLVRVPEAREVMARLTFSGLLNNGRADLPVVGQGIEPGPEARLGSYVQILRGRGLVDADRYNVMLGEGLASALKVAPGDSVVLLANTLNGALNTVDLNVVGIFRSFSREFDERAVRIPLATAQELLGTDGANTVVVELNRTSRTDAVASTLRPELSKLGLAVVTWNEIDDFYEKTVKLYESQFAVLELIVLLMVLLSAFNTVNMNVFERMAEFGTMRSLGNRARRVVALIVLENVFTGCAGAVIGGTAGIAAAALISAIGIAMPPPPNSSMGYTAQIRLVPSVIASAMLVGVAATVLASIAPANRAARLPIAESLRRAI
jgi:putative ABC transport system permease protein